MISLAWSCLVAYLGPIPNEQKSLEIVSTSGYSSLNLSIYTITYQLAIFAYAGR